MKLKLIRALALAGGLTLAAAACSGSDNADRNGAATDGGMQAGAGDTAQAVAPDSHAAQFLTDAIKGDNSEIKLGQLAADKGSSDGVKDFGKTLKDDHSDARDQAAKVATSLGVAVPTETKPEADAEYQKLQGLSGAQFDKEFVSYMVNDHQKDIDTFQQEAASSDPAEVTGLARNTLPTLQKHLQTAQSLQGS